MKSGPEGPPFTRVQAGHSRLACVKSMRSVPAAGIDVRPETRPEVRPRVDVAGDLVAGAVRL